MKDFLLSLLTPENIAWAVGALMTVAAGFVGTKEIRRRRIALAAYYAFNIVKDLADETPGPDALDKVAAGLKAADDYMKANGWRALKPGEAELAKLSIKAFRGAEASPK